ncbi:hypothetical protein VCR4J5_1270251 [Vibrio crassostreae]|uniref:Uncharacterized protein n=1 Tax=Vibrio crassostreae TaxID=246167 RepID=A0ABP1WTA7_9VIBR|nr:hypothetical protein VCR19J5_1200011 [Vibrio crassostreae]CDT01368.1 hypothetical protein VCR4J5_1270251 [Vibrio crassostreae]
MSLFHNTFIQADSAWRFSGKTNHYRITTRDRRLRSLPFE